MRRGKEIAQGSHASMAFLTEQITQTAGPDDSPAAVRLSDRERAWLSRGMAKVCLRVSSEDELLEYHEKALRQGLQSHLITDSGRTEFAGVPTLTACAIGPDYADAIDRITGALTPY